MSAPNFCKYEATKYYAIGMSTNESEIFDSWYFDEIKENIVTELENLTEKATYYTLDSDNVNHKMSRYYGGSYIHSLALNKTFGDVTINVVCHIIISNGRYEGATLDYITDIQIDGYSFDNYKDFLKHFDYTDLDYYSKMPVGMQKIQSKNIEKFVRSATPELTEQVEQILSEYCQLALIKTAQFSNGEAIYEKAS
ncbi:hypothetical protein CLV62_104108 [Dysgonomonas alginatilytica]|uniref:Uncharacterized protein n=1 Tax=Dysgonomonas alginatilytica TaxID=1605892 RepID=A0A2V3PR38_9BACT|nr:hypothetical protein [Dysgonomonas alginatilytica]PXV66847.1 hypothetical protein CLV62_104108 [Dysgonomonas alginatilytica]